MTYFFRHLKGESLFYVQTLRHVQKCLRTYVMFIRNTHLYKRNGRIIILSDFEPISTAYFIFVSLHVLLSRLLTCAILDFTLNSLTTFSHWKHFMFFFSRNCKNSNISFCDWKTYCHFLDYLAPIDTLYMFTPKFPKMWCVSSELLRSRPLQNERSHLRMFYIICFNLHDTNLITLFGQNSSAAQNASRTVRCGSKL